MTTFTALFRRWIARIVLVALTLEVGLICSLYTGDFPLLRRGEEGVFHLLLSTVREIDSDEVILEASSEADQWSLRTLEPASETSIDWSVVEVPLSSELFDGKVPKPSEYAVLLAKLHQAGVRDLAFTQNLTWEEAPELELLALDSALRPFESALLPLDVTEVPRPDGFPSWLAGSLVPRESLVGDASRLPLVNQLVTSSSLSEREGLVFAFPDFGGRDLQFRAEGRLPLLTRWQDKLLVSWPLRLAMQLEGVTPEQLVIEPGRHLRLGANGPLVPLDDFGRAKGEAPQASTTFSSVSAKSLFPLGGVDLPRLEKGTILFDATGPDERQRSERLLTEAQFLRQFPRPGREEIFQRLSFGWELVLYLEIILVAIFALHLRPFWQLISLAVLCVALFVFALGILHWRGLWTPILPLVAAMTISWCLVGYLQQIAHPVRPKKKKAA